jgi:xanthine dehydrogenase iron-sulfur cluster and FAD-binding subunit A
VVGATAVVALEAGRVADARVAITALAPTIRRVAEAEAALTGSDGGAEAVAVASRAVGVATQPISDVRASADYRRAMAAVIGRRAIEVALARARGEHVPVPASPAVHGGLR